ncbi:MAG: DUF1501 domain-containing protein [Opitutaceae bacterium]
MSADSRVPQPLPLSRRAFLLQSWGGLGAIVLGALVTQHARAAGDPRAARIPDFQPRARRVVFIFLNGGPSQVDLWDPKPELVARHGQRPPGKVPDNGLDVGMDDMRLMRPLAEFKPHGQSGIELSELLPHLSRHTDDLCLLRGLHTDNSAHEPAILQMHTGSVFHGRPSFGSWLSYGLGTLNENLPAFVALGGNANASHCGFLPAIHQGTPLTTAKRPIKYLHDATETPDLKRAQFELTQRLNHAKLAQAGPDPHLDGMIQTMELAFRMQTEASGLGDFSQEANATLEAYGVGGKDTDETAKKCLLARRCLEAGVRFVLINQGSWDHHLDIAGMLPESARQMDQPVAALLADLKQRGLLEDTLVVCMGEFGRTSAAQMDPRRAMGKPGRNHNRHAFTGWIAGGGFKPGLVYGATDDLGFSAVDGKVHVHDLHATLLHQLGIDHTELTFRHAGRDYRLTDVAGKVVKPIIT